MIQRRQRAEDASVDRELARAVEGGWHGEAEDHDAREREHLDADDSGTEHEPPERHEESDAARAELEPEDAGQRRQRTAGRRLYDERLDRSVVAAHLQHDTCCAEHARQLGLPAEEPVHFGVVVEVVRLVDQIVRLSAIEAPPSAATERASRRSEPVPRGRERRRRARRSPPRRRAPRARDRATASLSRPTPSRAQRPDRRTLQRGAAFRVRLQ